MAGFIDIHSHLDHCKVYERIDEVISNCKKSGVIKVLSAGVNQSTNRKTLELSKRYDIIKACLGIYPIDALQNEIENDEFLGKDNKFDIDEEIKFIEKNRGNIAAVGECGLDYKSGGDKEECKKIQKEVFLKQIELAEKIKKPLIIHSRKAEEDVIDMLKSSNVKKAILHCFCGKKKLVVNGSDLGYSFSIPTNVVSSQQFWDMIKIVNICQLFCETDSPYLSPIKGQWNEPANVIESYKMIAKIKGFELEEVKNNIFMNYKKMFE